jgi:hypothetical protein
MLVELCTKEVAMKAAKSSNSSRHARDGASTPMFVTSHRSRTAETLPGLMASVFGKLDVKGRARLLGRLLGSVGPLALAVVGGGVFVKYLPNARWPVVPVSFEDAAVATSSQVYELVRYVEQSNPNLLEGVLTALMQDGMTMTALGVSIAAMAIKQISDRNGPVAASPHQDLKK